MLQKEKPLSDKALEAEITNKGQGSKSIGEKLDKFTSAKHRQDVILNHLRDISTLKVKPPVIGQIDYKKTIAQISDCFNYLKFRDYYLISENRLVEAYSCKKHLLCAPCAIRRASVAIGAYLEKFNEINALNSDLDPYMLTLTVKNGEDLQERFKHLQKSMKKIMKSRRDYAAKGTGFNEFCKIEGAVYSYELTHSKHGWHPHIHMIVLLKKGTKIDFSLKNPKASRLSKDWHKVTGDSFIVDVRAIYGSTSVQGFVEVFKYALKFSDLSPEQNLYAYSFLRSKRLQGSFGLFRGVEIPDSLDEDPIKGQPFIEMVYRYLNSTYNLVKQVHVEI